MTTKTEFNMDVKSLINWFVDRDIEIEINDKTKYKVLGAWLFIENPEHGFQYKEVELYNLNNIYGECYDSRVAKDFNWKKENLLKIIECCID
tara:strand:- start:68 stop:343 length:276 start_codon:yes stop_codon:yes gene_type:complete